MTKGKTKKQLLEELEALQETERLHRLLVEHIGDVFWIRDLNLQFTYLSPSVTALTGYTPEEAMSLPLVKTYTPESIQKALAALQEEQALEASGTGETNRTRKLEMEGYAKDGSRVWTESVITFLRAADGKVTGILGISRDITERKQHEEVIRQLAFFDYLTGLPNRRLLADRFLLAKGQSRRAGKGLGLLLLDLDRFKEINDRFGHHWGDQLLIAVGERLGALLRNVDTVARLGGDEFAVLLPETALAADAVKVAEKIIEAFHAPFQVDGQQLSITTSIGLAACPQDGSELDELLKKADTALYEAKDLGRNRFQDYGQLASGLKPEVRLYRVGG
ncbi:MAG: GGDEF domain-containing protein [Deltaproteobacteria bacterium]|nr:GGDEF domain-containing protein [Deltaproteobacteria bacterium]